MDELAKSKYDSNQVTKFNYEELDYFTNIASSVRYLLLIYHLELNLILVKNILIIIS